MRAWTKVFAASTDSAANSTQLSQLTKATPGTLLHVRRKCQSAIEHNTETGEFIRYFNVNIGQSNRTRDVELGQQLLLRRTQPNKLSLIHVYLEAVREHSGTNVINARSDS